MKSATHPRPVRRKVGRYAQFLRWFIADGLWPRHRLVAAIVGADTAALALQVNAIGLVLYYVSLFEAGGTKELLGRSFEVRSSLTLLAGFSLAAVVLLATSALLRFGSRTWALRLRRSYSEACSHRVLSILQRSPLLAPSRVGPLSEPSLLFMARTDALTCGRSLFILVRAVAPMVTLVVAAAALAYVNVLLIFMLLLLAPPAAVFLYRVNVKAAEVSQLTESRAASSVTEFRRAVARLVWSPTGAEAGAATDWEASMPKTRRYMDAYVGRLQSINESELVSNLFFAVVLSAVLLSLGVQAIVWKTGWESMAWCLVALRYVLVAAREIVQTLTSINRFYPQARRYVDFVRVGAAPDAPAAEPREAYETRVDDPQLPGSASLRLTRAGQRLAVVEPFPVNRYTLSYILGALVGDDGGTLAGAVSSSRYVTGRYQLTTGSPRLDLSLDQEGWSEVKAWAETAGLGKQFESQLPATGRIGEDQWARINPSLKFLACLVAAMRTPSRWILLDEAGLRDLGEETRSRVLGSLGDRIVVIVYDADLDTLGRYGEQVVAVLDDEGLLGLGPVSWALEHRARIEALLSESMEIGAAGAIDEEAG